MRLERGISGEKMEVRSTDDDSFGSDWRRREGTLEEDRKEIG